MNKVSKIILYSFVSIVSLIMVFPFYLIIIGSITPEKEILMNGYQLIPDSLSLGAYKFVLNDFEVILSGYKISILVTLVGTFGGLFIVACMAYPLSRRDLIGHKFLAVFIIITMLVNGGMVSWYIVLTRILHLKNTLGALILPILVNPFFIFLLRNFFSTLPNELREAAFIDGAGEWKIFTRIILPLSKPGLATVGLFIALGYWNDWWHGIMLIDSNELFPLQILLRKIVSNTTFIQSGQNNAAVTDAVASNIPAEGVKMVTSIFTIGPVVIFYPFVQRFFIKGITLGGVKG